jgi:hypothetical protein
MPPTLALARFLPVDPSHLRHTVLPLPRIPATQLHVNQPHARFARALAPLIVMGITHHPAWAQRERATAFRLSYVTALAVWFPAVRLACCPRTV